MRLGATIAIMICSSVVLAHGQEDTATSKNTVRFPMPASRSLNIKKPVTCVAIVSAAIYEERIEMEDFDKPKLSAIVSQGTDKLKLRLEGNGKILKVQVKDEKPDQYRVAGHNVSGGWLVALHSGGLVPTAYSISLNINNGFLVWSLNEPIFVMGSLYPFAQSVYMHCTN